MSPLNHPFQMFGDLILSTSLNSEILDSQKASKNFTSTSAEISPWLLRSSHLLTSVLAFFFLFPFPSYFFLLLLKLQFSDLSLFHNKKKINFQKKQQESKPTQQTKKFHLNKADNKGIKA